jgi:hypothetical protein
MMHYHGTPITPRTVLHTLAGKNFCVSYSAPNDIKECHRIGQSVMLDNGAFSVWKRGITVDWDKWAEWVKPWLAYRTTWAILPDSIRSGGRESDLLVSRYAWELSGCGRVMPVWHLHERLERLSRLTDQFGWVAFGSSGTYSVVGTDAWTRRVDSAFNTLVNEFGIVPWVHMLRGMALSEWHYPFASVDSTDVARNHYLEHNNAREMADRWDAQQCPATWVPHEQLEIVA